MLLAISDASVLVDMADTKLLEPLAELPYRFVVPAFVVIRRPPHGARQIRSRPPDASPHQFQIRAIHPRLVPL